MRTFGEMPVSHAVLLEELIKLEEFFIKGRSGIPALIQSKGLVSMAHDYYQIFMEEEGERLIELAVKVTPDYFKGPIYDHMQKDALFNQVVYQMEGTRAMDLMVTLGYRD